MLEWIRPIPVVFLGVGIFSSIILIMYVLEKCGIMDPYPRKGFLPLSSTPGFRYFVGAIALFYIYLIGLAVIPSHHLVTFSIGVVVLLIVMIWG